MFRLPSRLYIYSIGELLRGYREVMASGSGEIDIDASALRYIDPLGLCMLAAMVNKLDAAGIHVNISRIDPDIFDYLRRMDFLKQCRMDKGLAPTTRRERADSLVEVHRINDRSEIDKSAARLANAVVGRISEDIQLDNIPDEMSGKSQIDRLEMPLRYVFDELLENALTHARGRGYSNAQAWIAAQYYPQSGKVRLAVVDDGCGFLESLRGNKAVAANTHMAAIEAALKARVSRNREVGVSDELINQGVGLTVTREIALRAGGCLALVSGDAWLVDYPGDRRQRKVVPDWQGVAAYVELKRSSLQDVDMALIMRALPGYAPVKGLRFDH